MRISHLLLFIICTLFFGACQSNQKKESKQQKQANPMVGTYHGELSLQGETIPIAFEIQEKPKKFVLINGPERFEIDSFYWQNDSISVPMHIFDTRLSARLGDEGLRGHWVKNYLEDYRLPFSAKKHASEEHEVKSADSNVVQLANKYRVYFSSMLSDSTISVGKFSQDGNAVKGTFLTETGDYRFLYGHLQNQKLRLSTFDGEHAFLFKADVQKNGEMNGHFWSGKTWHETWSASPDTAVKLSSADSLTYLKDGYDKFTFVGKSLFGKTMTHESAEFEGKAVIVQIMGSWCPNCMDETEYLAKWYHTKKPDSVEMVALAFERKDDFDYAKKRLEVMKLRYDIDYPLLFAGLYHKDSAALKLPALNQVVAYPTLVLMDKNHEVKYIHTGFNGPGTGEAYERWKLKFNKKVKDLL